jgi:hypothetical protein
MKRKNYTIRILLAMLAFSLILAFVFPLNAQVIAGGDDKTDLSTGTWVLTERNITKFNNANVTNWGGIEQNLTANCVWTDILKIEHSISCGFKWMDPPSVMFPGKDTKFAIEYIYDDYASTCKVVYGIKAKIDNVAADYMAAGPNSVDIVKLTKDNKNTSSETKTVYFTAPKTFIGDTNQMQLMVDCYIGQDHYVTYYTYSWVEGDGSASK